MVVSRQAAPATVAVSKLETAPRLSGFTAPSRRGGHAREGAGGRVEGLAVGDGIGTNTDTAAEAKRTACRREALQVRGRGAVHRGCLLGAHGPRWGGRAPHLLAPPLFPLPLLQFGGALAGSTLLVSHASQRSTPLARATQRLGKLAAADFFHSCFRQASFKLGGEPPPHSAPRRCVSAKLEFRRPGSEMQPSSTG